MRRRAGRCYTAALDCAASFCVQNGIILPPARRRRRTVTGLQVPGCHEVLEGLRFFFVRRSVCLAHASASSVMLNGTPVRFCQQVCVQGAAGLLLLLLLWGTPRLARCKSTQGRMVDFRALPPNGPA